MNICDDLILVQKDVDVTKAAPSPHRLEDLTVNEVSLVTEPAIITPEESAAHKGFTVVKLDDPSDHVPEFIRKAVDTLDGEDLGAAVQRLAAVCRKRLLMETGDAETYYMSPLKVFKDHVMMGFWWEDDTASLAASGKVAYFNCYYTQDATTKEFSVSHCAGLVVSMQETAAAQVKNAESVAEVAPEIVEPVIEAAAESEPAPAEPEAPAAEPAAETVKVDEPIAEVPAAEAAPEVAPVVEATAVEPTTKMSEILLALVAIGKSFEVDVNPEGKTTIRVVEKSTPPAQPADGQSELERVRIERDAAVRGQDELRKRIAKTVSEEPPSEQEIGEIRKNVGGSDTEVSTFGRVVAAGVAQTQIHTR